MKQVRIAGRGKDSWPTSSRVCGCPGEPYAGLGDRRRRPRTDWLHAQPRDRRAQHAEFPSWPTFASRQFAVARRLPSGCARPGADGVLVTECHPGSWPDFARIGDSGPAWGRRRFAWRHAGHVRAAWKGVSLCIMRRMLRSAAGPARAVVLPSPVHGRFASVVRGAGRRDCPRSGRRPAMVTVTSRSTAASDGRLAAALRAWRQ